MSLPSSKALNVWLLKRITGWGPVPAMPSHKQISRRTPSRIGHYSWRTGTVSTIILLFEQVEEMINKRYHCYSLCCGSWLQCLESYLRQHIGRVCWICLWTIWCWRRTVVATYDESGRSLFVMVNAFLNSVRSHFHFMDGNVAKLYKDESPFIRRKSSQCPKVQSDWWRLRTLSRFI